MEVKTKPNTPYNNSRNLPPGFRFHPTDEELIVHYLKNQAMSKPLPVSIIPEVDIYKFDPWQLPEKAEFGEKEWYFFTPRERKYPNGVRPNRAAVSGYWKATGTDKPISSGSRFVGIKKALVFYMGRPPKGIKTDWIMHEYRLNQPSSSRPPLHHLARPLGSMRLDDWVLCRIYRKRHAARRALNEEEERSENQPPMLISSPTIKNEPSGSEVSEDHQLQQDQQHVFNFPRTCSLTHLLELDYLGPITHLLDDADGSYNANPYDFPSNINVGNSGFDTNGNGQSSFGDLSRTSMNQIGAGLSQQWQFNSSSGYKFP